MAAVADMSKDQIGKGSDLQQQWQQPGMAVLFGQMVCLYVHAVAAPMCLLVFGIWRFMLRCIHDMPGEFFLLGRSVLPGEGCATACVRAFACACACGCACVRVHFKTVMVRCAAPDRAVLQCTLRFLVCWGSVVGEGGGLGPVLWHMTFTCYGCVTATLTLHGVVSCFA
jgi:hypothetical protein